MMKTIWDVFKRINRKYSRKPTASRKRHYSRRIHLSRIMEKELMAVSVVIVVESGTMQSRHLTQIRGNLAEGIETF